MMNFGKGAEVMELANVADTISILNAATCASLANEKEASKQYYIKLLKANYKSPVVFITLSKYVNIIVHNIKNIYFKLRTVKSKGFSYQIINIAEIIIDTI